MPPKEGSSKTHNIYDIYTRDKCTNNHTKQRIYNANMYHAIGLPFFSIVANSKASVKDFKGFFLSCNVGLGTKPFLNSTKHYKT